MRRIRCELAVLLLGAWGAPLAVGEAQYGGSPSFQIPRSSNRDFNFGVADAGRSGTTLVFQWREGVGEWTHLTFDAGLVDPGGNADVRLLLGGGFAYWMSSASDEMPLDLALTGGVGGTFGSGVSLLRVPVGLSVGHRFVLDAPITVTPYAHPRLSLDYCSRCGGRRRGDTDFSVDVDLGVDVEVSTALSLRASILLAASNDAGRDDAFGISLVWRPPTVR